MSNDYQRYAIAAKIIMQFDVPQMHFYRVGDYFGLVQVTAYLVTGNLAPENIV